LGSRQNTELLKSADAQEDRQFIKSLARGFEVLQAFRAEDNGLSNAELSKRTGYPRSTLSRLTFTLLALNYLHLDENSGKYFLHPHILSLGYPVLSRLSIRELARPMMQELADSLYSAVVLGIRDGLNMIVIERARHSTMATWPSDIGIARDIATSALGRACIVALDDQQREALISELCAKNPARAETIKTGIDSSLASYAEHGYTVSEGDWVPEYSAVGVPLKLRDGNIIAFNCGGYSNRLNREQLDQMGQQLVQLVKRFSQFLGSNPV